jgi:TetR/AcrR family transcriptional regulator
MGRPRVSGTPSQGDSPREEIIAAAARLFAERGFGQVTMGDIAEAAGLQGPSLYYWFKRKDLILQAIFSVDRAPLEFIERIGPRERQLSAVTLYRLIRFDAYQLCLSPCDVNEVARLASEPGLFPEFWTYRHRLHEWVSRLIRSGIADGVFVEVDPELVSWGVLASDAGVQSWFRYQAQQPPDVEPTTYSAIEIATSVADSALRALLRRTAQLSTIRAAASRYNDLEVTAPS